MASCPHLAEGDMTTAIGIDQSSKTGWCFGGTKVPLDQWTLGHFKSPKREEVGERLISIEDSLGSLISLYKPDILFFEEPWMPLRELMEKVRRQAAAAAKGAWEELPLTDQIYGGMNLDTICLLQMIKGACLMAAARAGIPTEGFQPRSWRATLKLPKPPSGLVTWQSRQKFVKQQTLAWVRRMGGKAETEDEADAFGIVMHGLHGSPGIARAQGDLLAMVEDLLRA
jgi:Holliday junction resolvasome RuvABC endonuclease subunit